MLFGKKKEIKTSRKYSDYLPVGSIVKLYNDDTYYMIFRYSGNQCLSYKANDRLIRKSKLYDAENKEKLYYHMDYFIEEYPTSIEDFAIIHEDIEEVIWEGYTDEMRVNILKDIDEWSREDE